MPSNKRHLGEHTPVKRGSLELGVKRFFQKQLPGEEALTFTTAKRLFDLAEELLVVQPWQALADTELILVKDPQLGGFCFCSVLGQLGEIFAVHAYRGMRSYCLFKKMAAGGPIDVGEFFGEQHSLTLEFLTPGKLSPADRDLALVLGHRLKKGTMVPQFRAGRPGYRPWYPTEREAKVLALCVESVLAFCQYAADNPDFDSWQYEDVYPKVVWTNKKFFRVENDLVRVTVPPPEPAPLDQGRLEKLCRRDYPLRGIIEVDPFYSGAPVGEKNQRKACLRVVMSVDAETRFLYTVQALEPVRSLGEVLVEGVLQTIEKGKFVPAEVRVKQEGYRLLLLPVKERFGFELRVLENLPALEFAKEHLQRTLGDLGRI